MRFGRPKTIYLDHAAATPIDRNVALLTEALSKDLYANPSAIHKGGVAARNELEKARLLVAKFLFAHSDEIIFTGSGTESDALAIRGAVLAYQGTDIPHIITTAIEHPAVLENCRMLEREGKASVTYVECDERGIVDPKEIKKAIRENTIVVSVMYANNEIGTIQPIEAIAKEIRHFRKEKDTRFPLLHTDACQAMNHLPVENIEKLGVDLLSFNSSKIYGPKGVGILYKKRGVELAGLYGGGGQEMGLRSGTEDVASIAGAARALAIAAAMKEKESIRLSLIRDEAIKKILALSAECRYEITLNGDPLERLPNNINISIDDISSELLVIELDARGILVSSKSACKADDPDESYVIASLRKAQGKEIRSTDGSLRITLGRENTSRDMDAFTAALKAILLSYKQWK